MTSWLSDVLVQLAGLTPRELAAAFAFYAASLAFRATAWRNILAATADATVPWSSAGTSFLAGAGANAVAPARVGIGIRIALARFSIRRLGWAELTGTLGVEAVFNSIVGAAFMAWGIATLARSDVSLVPSPRVAVFVLLASALVAGLLMLVRRAAHDRLRTTCAGLGRSFSALRDQRRIYLRRIAIWQAADWLARLATIALVLRAAGMEHGLHTVLLVQAGLCVAALLPLMPAGIGAKQGALVLVLAGIAPSASLVAFGIALTLVHALVDVTLGVAALAVIARQAGSPAETLSLLWRSARRPALRPR